MVKDVKVNKVHFEKATKYWRNLSLSFDVTKQLKDGFVQILTRHILKE